MIVNYHSRVGRPSLDPEQVYLIFRKLEPFLRMGHNLHKACLLAQIPKSTVYDLYHESEEFAENIERAKNFKSVIFSDLIFRRLMQIYEKSKKDIELLNKEEWKFLFWLAQNDRSLSEEFGKGCKHIIQKENNNHKPFELDKAKQYSSEELNVVIEKFDSLTKQLQIA